MVLVVILFFIGLLVGSIFDHDGEGGGCGLGILLALAGIVITIIFAPPVTREVVSHDVLLYNMSDIVRSQGGLLKSSTDEDYLIFETIDPETGALQPQKMKKFDNAVNIFLDNPELPYMRTFEVVYTSSSPVYWLFRYPKFDGDNRKEFHVPANTVDKIYLIH